MGSVGKDLEKGVSGFGSALGLGGSGNKQLGSGGKFAISDNALKAENDVLSQLQNKITGKGQFIADLQYKQAMNDLLKNNMSAAASGRGVSNSGLLQRNAMMATQQGQLDLAQQSTIAKMQEQQMAQQMAAQIAAGQRGIALQGANANLGAKMKVDENNRETIARIGGAAASTFGGGGAPKAAHGAVVPGEPVVPGDSELNDTKPYMLSPGEVVVPRTVASDPGKLKSFIEALKNGETPKTSVKEAKPSEDKEEDDYSEPMAKLLASMAEVNKRLKKLEK